MSDQPELEGGDNSSTVAAGQLRAFIERWERLDEEKRHISSDMKDILAEAKGVGYDTKTIRAILKMRKKDQAELQEERAMLELYCEALGMF